MQPKCPNRDMFLSSLLALLAATAAGLGVAFVVGPLAYFCPRSELQRRVHVRFCFGKLGDSHRAGRRWPVLFATGVYMIRRERLEGRRLMAGLVTVVAIPVVLACLFAVGGIG